MNHAKVSLNLPDGFPQPDTDAVALCEQLSANISNAIKTSGGIISFDQYMEMALYEPGLGYYSNGLQKFGSMGDFTTAPETSALFGRCLANAILPVLKAIDQPEILEFGAGSGVMAVDILRELKHQGMLPDRYCIMERSATLKLRQRERFEREIPELIACIDWVDDLSGVNVRGVILANEVLDALSVKQFRWINETVVEQGVCVKEDVFAFQAMSVCDETMSSAVQQIPANKEWCEGYHSEWSPMLTPWVQTMADSLDTGAILLIDYGSVKSEYYHAQRHGGSLMCHYRHRAHCDPFVLPGLQDITAYVDFSAVAEAADLAGLQVRGFTTQTHFLLSNKIDVLMSDIDPTDQQAFFKCVNECKTLTMPGEMGERFKVIGLSKNIDADLDGFNSQDLRGRL